MQNENLEKGYPYARKKEGTLSMGLMMHCLPLYVVIALYYMLYYSHILISPVFMRLGV